MDWQKFEKIDYLSVTRDEASVAVILFHGYGADASDLSSLAQVYKLKKNADWFFPQGVLQVPIGPMMTGRAWFELNAQDFENMAARKVNDSPMSPKHNERLNQVSRFINHIGKMYDQVFIGGFSQGAILTSHSLYRLNFTPAGLVLLSGFLVSPSAFPTLPDHLKVPFFQSHGSRDEVLPIDGARQLYEKMQQEGLKGRWMEFNGGHEIPMDVIAESQIFVNSILDPQG